MDYSKADWTKFNNDLNERLTEREYKTIEDIDMKDTKILLGIIEAQKTSIPAKNIKLNKNKNNKPLPKFLLDIIKIKRRAHRLYMRQRTDDNERIYRRTQEDVKAAIAVYDEINYKNFTNKLQDLWTSNPKKFWETISRIRHIKLFNNHPLKDGNTITYEDTEKA